MKLGHFILCMSAAFTIGYLQGWAHHKPVKVEVVNTFKKKEELLTEKTVFDLTPLKMPTPRVSKSGRTEYHVTKGQDYGPDEITALPGIVLTEKPNSIDIALKAYDQ